MSKKKKKNKIFDFPSSCKGGINVTGASYSEMKAVSDVIDKSDTCYHVERLDEVINQGNYKMSNWEVDQLNQFYEKFSAQYNSPLAKALK